MIAATSLYLDYQYSSLGSPRLVLIVNSWTLSKAFDRSSPENVDPPPARRRIQTVILSKNTYTLTQVLRELIMLSKSQIIFSVTRSVIFILEECSNLHEKLALYRWTSSIEDDSIKHENPLKIGWKKQKENNKQIWKIL